MNKVLETVVTPVNGSKTGFISFKGDDEYLLSLEGAKAVATTDHGFKFPSVLRIANLKAINPTSGRILIYLDFLGDLKGISTLATSFIARGGYIELEGE
ncbi:hypothetical protein KAMAJI_00510 [Serratia phage vB_SmaM-Kamaji]|nr:hypothetical protein KAMAJI_00510 [Serratia phage vB_SmaM-Kamaji]